MAGDAVASGGMASTLEVTENGGQKGGDLPAGVCHVPTPVVEGEWTVDKVIDQIPNDLPKVAGDSPIPFFHFVERLKTTKREGWRRFGVFQGESVAEHMYRMAILTMVAPPGIAATVDLAKCMKMCLVHDMAEALVGDITPVDPISKPEKSRREADTMAYVSDALLGTVHGGMQGQELKALWTEYETGDSRETAFVKDLDKVELLLQMVEYEKRGAGRLDLEEFCYVATRIALPETRKWADEIIAERTAFWKTVAEKQAP